MTRCCPPRWVCGDVALGEITWALTRGALYAAGFLVVMLVLGLIHSPWAILALPAALLIGFAAAGLGTAATTFVRSWQDFDLVFVVTLPLFLFSAHVLPDHDVPGAAPHVRRVHAALPGRPPGSRPHHRRSSSRCSWWTCVYLVVLGSIGLAITSRRMGRLLLK